MNKVIALEYHYSLLQLSISIFFIILFNYDTNKRIVWVVYDGNSRT